MTPARGSVAIVCPTYQHARFIGRTLTSLLEQSRPPDQIIVVNDGSPDDTADAVRPFLPHIVYVEQENRGVVRAANRGLQMCSTDYVMGFSSDDILEPEALETLAARLDAHPDVGLVHGNVRYIDADDRPIPGMTWVPFPVGRHREVRRLMLRSYIAGTAAMFRRRALQESMPLLPPYADNHDWAQWVAVGLAGWWFFGCDRVITSYRRHDINASDRVRRSGSYRNMLAIVAELRARFDGRLTPYDVASLDLTQRMAERKLAWIAMVEGDRREARAGFRGLWRNHGDVRAAVGAACTYAPDAVWRRLRSVDRALMRRSNVASIWLKQRI